MEIINEQTGGLFAARSSKIVESRIIKINPKRISSTLIDRVARLLHQGGVIGYPTETVYGLGGNAEDSMVVDRIYRLKGRDHQQPFLVLVGDREALTDWIDTRPAYAEILMDHFWPGPLTLIFRASSRIPVTFTHGLEKVAVRISSDPVCRHLLDQFKKPLISTSANPSGKKAARSAQEVLDYFGDRIDLVLDGGERTVHRPSTIVDVTKSSPSYLRIGAISKQEIQRILGDEK